jgi:hypothetical protein
MPSKGEEERLRKSRNFYTSAPSKPGIRPRAKSMVPKAITVIVAFSMVRGIIPPLAPAALATGPASAASFAPRVYEALAVFIDI